ncbi:uncharacterized protein EI90DRAFT_3137761 [Cantharellus anzutake]|uniref:uncharacterized protein n=1 Tax=Cantharellus anzutake TaxID=1750568 RepID=UPI001905934F|nr:uncharacterized protein EI90DRAFT_3137761 [Cantharellus anzutake]KAF8312035.1 hypothetical protein EI90DRAFT_3137761 [Cantharellus anzutake]
MPFAKMQTEICNLCAKVAKAKEEDQDTLQKKLLKKQCCVFSAIFVVELPNKICGKCLTELAFQHVPMEDLEGTSTVLEFYQKHSNATHGEQILSLRFTFDEETLKPFGDNEEFFIGQKHEHSLSLASGHIARHKRVSVLESSTFDPANINHSQKLILIPPKPPVVSYADFQGHLMEVEYSYTTITINETGKLSHLVLPYCCLFQYSPSDLTPHLLLLLFLLLTTPPPFCHSPTLPLSVPILTFRPDTIPPPLLSPLLSSLSSL